MELPLVFGGKGRGGEHDEGALKHYGPKWKKNRKNSHPIIYFPM